MKNAQEPNNVALEGRRVLVAEDEALIADELLDELERLGAEPVGPVSTVSNALAIIEQEPLSLGLINVVLRGETTSPIADALIARNIPFMFVTGNEAFVHEHYPNVPIHPKPSNLALLVRDLERLITMGGHKTLSPDAG